MNLQVRMDNAPLRMLAEMRANIPRIMETGLQRVAIEASGQVVFQIKPGNSLIPHSGGLAKSWVPRTGAEVKIETTAIGAKGYLASNHPASRIQNVGGEVTPKTAKYLAIPLDDAKTKSGVPRWASPREVPGLSVIPVRGRLYLVRKTGTGTAIKGGRIRRTAAKIEWLFLLVKSVTVPPSRYIDRATASTIANTPGIMNAVMQEAIDLYNKRAAK